MPALQPAWTAVVAAAFLLPLLKGGVTLASAWVLWGLASFALGAELVSAARDKSAPRALGLPRVAWLLGATACWQVLLLIPVPDGVAALVGAEQAALRRFVWSALGDAQPTLAPLAVNPALAATDAARLWSTLILCAVTARRVQRGQNTSALYAACAVGAYGQIALGTLAEGGGPTASGALHGAFVNPNHTAASLGLSIFAAALAVRSTHARGLKLFWLLTGVVAFGGVLLTQSRAGISAVTLGLGVMLALWPRRRRFTAASLILALSCALLTWLFAERLNSRFTLRTDEKTRVWPAATALAGDHLLGTGRGGFGLVFPAVRPIDSERGRWDYVENEVIQTLVDYGPAGGALLLGCGAWLMVVLARRARDRSGVAARQRGPRTAAAIIFAAALALSAHNLFDFNWELAGIFVPAWLLLFASARGGERHLSTLAFDAPRPWQRWTLPAGAALSGALLLYGDTLAAERLDARINGGDMSALTTLVRTRPLDAWAHVQLANRAGNDIKARVAWLNRAALVDPDWAEPHRALALLFCASGYSAQGRGEATLALDRMGGGNEQAFALLADCGADAPSRLGALILTQQTPGRAAWLHRFVPWLVDTGRHAHADNFYATARAAELPLAPQLRAAFARSARLRGLLGQARERLASDPAAPELALEHAELALAEHAPSALALFADAAAARTPQAVSRLVDVALQLRSADAAREGLRLAADACAADRAACVVAHALRAKVARAEGKHRLAAEEYKRILLAQPSDVGALLGAAEALAESNDVRAGIEVLRRGERLVQDPRVIDLRQRLEERLQRDRDNAARGLLRGE